MKIKKQTRKRAAGCSKHGFEVVDETDEVSNHTYGKVKLTWFEEIFEEYYSIPRRKSKGAWKIKHLFDYSFSSVTN